MKALRVGGQRSRLYGARCRHCTRTVREGETVLYQALVASDEKGYGENRFVVHVDCIAGVVAKAPVGRTPGDPRVQAAAMRRAIVEAGGDLFAAA